jgi:hypothetical protein
MGGKKFDAVAPQWLSTDGSKRSAHRSWNNHGPKAGPTRNRASQLSAAKWLQLRAELDHIPTLDKFAASRPLAFDGGRGLALATMGSRSWSEANKEKNQKFVSRNLQDERRI